MTIISIISIIRIVTIILSQLSLSRPAEWQHDSLGHHILSCHHYDYPTMDHIVAGLLICFTSIIAASASPSPFLPALPALPALASASGEAQREDGRCVAPALGEMLRWRWALERAIELGCVERIRCTWEKYPWSMMEYPWCL